MHAGTGWYAGNTVLIYPCVTAASLSNSEIKWLFTVRAILQASKICNALVG